MTLTPALSRNLARLNDRYPLSADLAAMKAPKSETAITKQGRAVIATRISDGADEHYPSTSRAGRAFGTSQKAACSAIKRAIRDGRVYRERKWRYAHA